MNIMNYFVGKSNFGEKTRTFFRAVIVFFNGFIFFLFQRNSYTRGCGKRLPDFAHYCIDNHIYKQHEPNRMRQS